MSPQHSLDTQEAVEAQALARVAELEAALRGLTPDDPWQREGPPEGEVTTDEPYRCLICGAISDYIEHGPEEGPDWWDLPDHNPNADHIAGCQWVVAHVLLAPQATEAGEK